MSEPFDFTEDEYLRHKAFQERWPATFKEAMEQHGYMGLDSPEGNRQAAKLLREGGEESMAKDYDYWAEYRVKNPSDLEYTKEKHRRVMAVLDGTDEGEGR